MTIRLLYNGARADFRWAGFGSGSGTNLRECARVIKPALIVTDNPSAGLLSLEQLVDVPKIVLDGKSVVGPRSDPRYPVRRAALDQEILERLEREGGYDLVVLGGYMRIVGAPLVSAYKDRIINVHPADLSILDENHARKYVGTDAVGDAMRAGERSTRSCVILVDGLVDHGEILVSGPAVRVLYPYDDGVERDDEARRRDYIAVQQSVQKVRSDWPALTTALSLIAEGRVGLDDEKLQFKQWRTVCIDGKEIGYRGLELPLNAF